MEYAKPKYPRYSTYQRNHVILSGREEALEKFLKKTHPKIGQHKLEHGFSSNSEDALTWSCFDLLENYPNIDKVAVLDEILEDSFRPFQDVSPLSFRKRGIAN